MMFCNAWKTGSIVAALAISLGCDADGDMKGPTVDPSPVSSPALDDATLATKVKESLARDVGSTATSVSVEAHNGDVVLGGFVDTQERKAAAGHSARTVQGVLKLDNRIAVKADTTTAGERIDDAGMLVRVKAALVAEPRTSAHEINVEVLDGVIQLTGFVDTADEKTRAGEVAGAVLGVTSVQNRLELKGS